MYKRSLTGETCGVITYFLRQRDVSVAIGAEMRNQIVNYANL
jgi:hypothetical protein